MLALLLALLCAPNPTPPDVLPPGHKSVRHELVLDWGDDLGGYRLFAYPTRGFHGHHEIRRGEPFTFSSKYGTKIYALPAARAFPEQRDEVAALACPSAPVPVAQVSSVAMSDPVARIETRVQVERATADGLEFTVLGTRRLGADGQETSGLDFLLLGLVAAIGLLAVIVLALRARAAAPSEA